MLSVQSVAFVVSWLHSTIEDDNGSHSAPSQMNPRGYASASQATSALTDTVLRERAETAVSLTICLWSLSAAIIMGHASVMWIQKRVYFVTGPSSLSRYPRTSRLQARAHYLAKLENKVVQQGKELFAWG